MRCDVMGVGFDALSLSEALSRAQEILRGTRLCMAVTPNAEMVWEAMHDADFRALLNSAELVLPDGAGVVLASKILGRPLPSRVPGIDFADALLSQLSQDEGVFLFGGKPGTAETAAERLRLKYPNLNICGLSDGYFEDDSQIIEDINRSGAKFLMVCLGSPKQELWMAQRGEKLTGVRLMAGLGGSLDGFAGTAKRAPEWMRRWGLEWLYRLIKQPGRFVRMLRLPKFLIAVIWTRLVKKSEK